MKKISIRALGRLKNHKVIRFLIPLLQDSDYHIVGEAISSLGESGAAEACPALITILQNNKSEFTSEILEALFALGEPRTFELAHDFLEKTSDDLRNNVIKLLMPHWNKSQLDEIANNFHKAEDHEKIFWLKTLAELKDPRALPILQEALQYKDLEIRAYAEWAIFHISH
jgi:HEAT repeat protein